MEIENKEPINWYGKFHIWEYDDHKYVWEIMGRQGKQFIWVVLHKWGLELPSGEFK